MCIYIYTYILYSIYLQYISYFSILYKSLKLFQCPDINESVSLKQSEINTRPTQSGKPKPKDRGAPMAWRSGFAESAKKKPVPMYQAEPARSDLRTKRSQRGIAGLAH